MASFTLSDQGDGSGQGRVGIDASWDPDGDGIVKALVHVIPWLYPWPFHIQSDGLEIRIP